jgi:23S rRNA-/tRNA-specific pseudouridylate synthase
LVWGNIENDKGSIEGNIGRHPKNRLQNMYAYLNPKIKFN